MIIPYQSLTVETLDNLLKEHVYREGTNYGEHEISIETQIEQLKRQLKQGDIVLVYSEVHESVNLLPKSQFQENQYIEGL